jgi:fumarylacetoacetate (FAA) hydrolase family protein
MELSKLKPNPTTTLELVHPDPEQNPTGVVLTLAGRDSAEVKAVLASITARHIAAQRKGVKAAKQEDIEADAIRLLAAAVLGWEGLTENGEPLPCTPENVTTLLTDYAWVRRQVDEAIGNDALFFSA